jgi:hypothetical protein
MGSGYQSRGRGGSTRTHRSCNRSAASDRPNSSLAQVVDGGMGDGLGYGLTDKVILKSLATERVFPLGDNTNVPTLKAGSVAHFQADAAVHKLLREISGEAAEPIVDAHANCFIETGLGKVILIDFNYDIQPVPGTFPVAGLGPMSLLKETRMNHLGTLAFKHVYWNALLRGLPIRSVGSQMGRAGRASNYRSWEAIGKGALLSTRQNRLRDQSKGAFPGPRALSQSLQSL